MSKMSLRGVRRRRTTRQSRWLNWIASLALAMTIPVSLPSCVRGSRSEKPPIHLVPDMDSQGKYDPQGEGPFFADRMAMRKPVKGTIAQGELRDDPPFYTGKDETGNLVATAPLTLSVADIERGQERYNIYCLPCHGRLADGNGTIPKKGFPPPPSFHNDRARAFVDGYFFDKITNGSAIMTSYAAQIPVIDRWRIVAYIRALQLSQHAAVEEVPSEMVEGVK